MLTLRCTQEGLEIMRFLPFIICGNTEGRSSSSSDSPGLPNQLTENGEENGD